MSRDSLKEFLHRVTKIKVLVIGDIMLDKYLIGRVDRMSPEAPVPVLRHETTERKVGGAGNVALNFRALGCKTYLAGILGKDEEGRLLSEKFEKEGIINCCYTIDHRPTTVKTRLMRGDEHLLRVDFEDDKPIDEETANTFASKIEEVIQTQRIDLVVIQDYNKGLLTPKVIAHILNVCQQSEIFTAVDPKFDNYWSYIGVNLFKPNLKEASTALGMKESETSDWQWIAGETRNRLSADKVVLTLSENGILVESKNDSVHGKPLPIDVVDVCGAGDGVLSVVSALAYLGYENNSLVEIGNLVGRQICGIPGVALIDPEELSRG